MRMGANLFCVCVCTSSEWSDVVYKYGIIISLCVTVPHSRDVRSRDRRDTRQLAHRIIIHKIRIDGVLVGLLNSDELLRVSRSRRG